MALTAYIDHNVIKSEYWFQAFEPHKLTPEIAITCGDFRSEESARLYLGSCIPARIIKQIESRELDRVLLGLSYGVLK